MLLDLSSSPAPAAALPQLSGVSPVGDKDLQDQGIGAGQKPVDVFSPESLQVFHEQ